MKALAYHEDGDADVLPYEDADRSLPRRTTATDDRRVAP